MNTRITGTSALAREIIVIDPTVEKAKEQKLRVAAYARVSSDSADQLNSFSAQVGYYNDLLKSQLEWEMVDIYADEGLTGTRADTRTDFQRMLKDCRKGKIDRILTKSISRFSRNTKDCLEILRELSTLGVTVYFEKENIDTSDMPNELIVTIFSSGAQEESYSISGNMRLGCKMRMKNGTYVASSTPYGYCLEDKVLTIVPEQAEIIRRIFSDYLSGKGMQAIATALNAEYVPCKHKNAKWTKESIAYLLRNERYMGDSMFQKSFTTDTLPFRKVNNYGEKDRYYVSNSHLSIVCREDFDRVQILLKCRKIKHSGGIQKQFTLKGKIRCGECGGSFRRKECTTEIYWVCYKHHQSKKECAITQIAENEFHKAFIALYNKLKSGYGRILTPLLEQLQTLKSNRNKNNAQVTDINKQIANLTEQNHVLNGLKSKGYIDSALFISQTNEINRQIAKLRADKNKLMESDDEDTTIIETKNLIDILDYAPYYINEFDEPLFESIVDKITVISNNQIKFRLINGLELNETIERQ